MTCVITGCAFHDADQDRSLWGDLHEIGDCWVFNGVVAGNQAQWQYGDDARVPDVTPTISANVPLPSMMFEKRGVIVLPKGCAVLNKAALKRI